MHINMLGGESAAWRTWL